MNSHLVEQEVQLKRTSVIPSHQDWFFGLILHFFIHLVNQLGGSDSSKADLAHLQEFVYSGLRAGFNAWRNVSHLWFNTVLQCQDAYVSDTPPTSGPAQVTTSGPLLGQQTTLLRRDLQCGHGNVHSGLQRHPAVMSHQDFLHHHPAELSHSLLILE